MKCPQCDEKTDVIDSRPAFAWQIRRRRRCPACALIFATLEVPVILPDYMVRNKSEDRMTSRELIEMLSKRLDV